MKSQHRTLPYIRCEWNNPIWGFLQLETFLNLCKYLQFYQAETAFNTSNESTKTDFIISSKLVYLGYIELRIMRSTILKVEVTFVCNKSLLRKTLIYKYLKINWFNVYWKLPHFHLNYIIKKPRKTYYMSTAIARNQTSFVYL